MKPDTIGRPLGVFGGTFDPVHLGHLRLAEEACDALQLERVRWIPAGQPTAREAPQASAAQRLAMVARAIAGNARFEVDRAEEHLDIARRNGEKILANPSIALDTITHGQATFTNRDLAMFVHRHSDGKEQFDLAMSAVRSSSDLIALGKDGRGEERFTSRQMIETEQRLGRAAELLAFGKRAGLVQNRDGALLLGQIALGPDRAAARERLRLNRAWRQMLEEQLLQAWNGNNQ